MPQLWKKIRSRLEVIGMRLLVATVPLLWRNFRLFWAHRAGDLVFALDRRGRAVALANLKMAFGDRYSRQERNSIARRSYRNLAQTFFDLFWITRKPPEVFHELIDVVGWDDVMAGKKDGQGQMFVCCHFGNLEMLPLVMSLRKMPVLGIGQDIKNPAVTSFFSKARSLFGNQMIPRQKAALRLFKALKRGGSCLMLVDLTLKLHEPGYLIECFGQKKWVTKIHVALAALTHSRLLPVVCLPMENGRYEFRFLPELKFNEGVSGQEMTQRCWDQFEALIRERPECWLWNYKHWRYQPEGAADYPFYARSGKKFQKIYAASRTTSP